MIFFEMSAIFYFEVLLNILEFHFEVLINMLEYVKYYV
jgi:hypothetical protein